MSRGPSKLEEEKLLVAHAARPAEDGLDRSVDAFDDTEANAMTAVGGDAIEVAEQEGAELLHLRQALPAERLEPAGEEVRHAFRVGVGPEAIELLAQDVGLEEAAVDEEEVAQLAALVAGEVPPAAQKEPALAAAVLAHDRTGAEELVATHLVDGSRRVLQDVKLVEDDLGARQLVRDGVDVWAVHVGAHGLDGGTLARVERTVEEAFERGLRAVARKADHLAVVEIGEHGPVALTTTALDLIGAEMARTPPRARAIPVLKKRVLCASRLAPAHTVADGGVARRHGLAVETDARLQPMRDARLWPSERNLLGADSAARAAHAPDGAHERHRMPCPRQVLPRADLLVATLGGRAATARAAWRAPTRALDSHPRSAERGVVLEVDRGDAVVRESDDPGKLAARPHSVVLPWLLALPRENTAGRSGGEWGRTSMPSSRRIGAGGRAGVAAPRQSCSARLFRPPDLCTQSDEEPKKKTHRKCRTGRLEQWIIWLQLANLLLSLLDRLIEVIG